MPASPLIVFVHTPKAAGTTVTRALAKLGKGENHVERYQSDPKRFLQAVEKACWISGHIPIDRFGTLLTGLSRPVRYFSALREPVAQVMSHYNWLIEIYHRGQKFYEGHPAQVRRISEHLRNSDTSDPQVVAGHLQTYPGLFLNFQSRFILGVGRQARAQRVSQAIRQFEYVSTDAAIDRLLHHIIPGLTADARENKSRYHFDPAIFADPAVAEIIRSGNQKDAAVYRFVRKQELRTEVRATAS